MVMLDASFSDNSKEIKDLLAAFISRYERFTDEEKAATKQWLDDLAALQCNAPACFHPKIIISKHFAIDADEGDWLRWSFPPGLLVEAIRAMEQKIKYVIDYQDKMDWGVD